MKNQLFTAALVAGLAAPAFAGNVDVGVSVQISQPGVWGRVDIGRFPQPQVVYPRPVVVFPPRVVVAHPVQPVYMWVPPGHRKNWNKHCRDYRACSAPVVFVRDDWYDTHVRHSDRRYDDRRYDDHRYSDRRDDDRRGDERWRGKGKHDD